MWAGQWGHTDPSLAAAGRDGFRDEALDFMDAALEGRNPTARLAEVVIQDGAGRWREEASWPVPGIRRGRLDVVPGEYLDAPGNVGEPGTNGGSAPAVPGRPSGRGAWSVSAPLEGDLHLSGSARLDVTVTAATPDAHLVALLYDIAPDGSAQLVERGATLVGDGDRVAFDLYPQDWRFAEGHRVGLLLTGADDHWYLPGTSGTTVMITGGTLAIPSQACGQGPTVDGGPSPAMASRTTIAAPSTATPTSLTAATCPR